jgi:tRNA G18 (ribose-2'-O)-methylase SpoU
VFSVLKIQSLEGPELQPYRTMRRQMDHRLQGIFVAEGEKVVRRLLESSFTVVSVLLPDKWLVDLEPLLHRRSEHIQVYLAEKKLLETLTGFSMYQGLLAIGRIPSQTTLNQLLERSSRPHLLVVVDGISSAENLGALVRNCMGFRVQALVTSENCCSPFLRRAVRSSMGAIFQLPVVENVSLLATLQELKRRGIHCVAAHPHVNGRTVAEANFTADCCIVFGSEGSGISPSALAECNDAVAIPMPPTIDSLNVASAAAVFLYEANRQRR